MSQSCRRYSIGWTPADATAALRPDRSDSTCRCDSTVCGDLEVDGIDIDYEQFAFADAHQRSDAPNWLRSSQNCLRCCMRRPHTPVSIPAVYDESVTGDLGYWVYDHGDR